MAEGWGYGGRRLVGDGSRHAPGRGDFAAALKRIPALCPRSVDGSVEANGAWRDYHRALRGYYQYHAVPGNLATLSRFRHRVVRLWYRTLCQRSQRRPTWQKLGPIFDHWLPIPHVVHELPGRSFRRQTSNDVTSKVRTVC